eukprot:TRINITY_DN4591_c0_g1_i1.p1 TRINITY_DN4591_c0_g1~~TRINITY_DN4591_c0_g1_i1.p1  ORF type:complete len:279 (+),score=98.86 TRINITY_DN4591_c0_g1_i1:165-1001(+)
MDAPVVQCRDHTQRFEDLRRKANAAKEKAGVAPAKRLEVSQPPLGWVSAVAKVEHAEGVISGLLRELEECQQVHLNSVADFGGDDVGEDPQEKIAAITAEIQRMFKTLDKALKAVVQDADDQNILMNVHRGVAYRISELYKQHTALVSRYTEALGKRNKQKAKLQNKIEGDDVREWEEQVRLETRQDELQDIGYTKYQIESIMMEEQIQREKLDAIKNIAAAVEELHSMFTDLSSLVHEQGEMLDRIDENISQTSMSVKMGLSELRLVNKRAKRCTVQ